MSGATGAAELVDLFTRQATAAGAVVHGPIALEAAYPLIRALTQETGRLRVLAWQGPALGDADAWARLKALGLQLTCPSLSPDRALRLETLAGLDEIEVGLTAAAGALADTGTIVVTSGAGRPRLAWLLPTRHIALVDIRRIHPTMEAFFESAAADASADVAHLAFVTGPSRTADIELTMTRGVHGPRELHVVLVDSRK